MPRRVTSAETTSRRVTVPSALSSLCFKAESSRWQFTPFLFFTLSLYPLLGSWSSPTLWGPSTSKHEWVQSKLVPSPPHSTPHKHPCSLTHTCVWAFFSFKFSFSLWCTGPIPSAWLVLTDKWKSQISHQQKMESEEDFRGLYPAAMSVLNTPEWRHQEPLLHFILYYPGKDMLTEMWGSLFIYLKSCWQKKNYNDDKLLLRWRGPRTLPCGHDSSHFFPLPSFCKLRQYSIFWLSFSFWRCTWQPDLFICWGWSPCWLLFETVSVGRWKIKKRAEGRYGETNHSYSHLLQSFLIDFECFHQQSDPGKSVLLCLPLQLRFNGLDWWKQMSVKNHFTGNKLIWQKIMFDVVFVNFSCACLACAVNTEAGLKFKKMGPQKGSF